MKCSSCGEEHPDDELELTFRRPDAIIDLPAEDWPTRVKEDADRAAIDGERFFLRGTLPLPVPERGSDYAIGVWVEVAPDTFWRVIELWSSEDQVDEPPFAATLANQIPSLPSTLGLHVAMKLTGPTTRPEFHLVAAEHQIYREQTVGITAHRIHEYNVFFALARR